MSERSAIIARRIAERIIQNTKKRWAGLHEDALSFAEKEIIQMSQEIHFTGNPNAGPMSPEATTTRGRSFAEVTGKNQNSDVDVSTSCQVQVSVPLPQVGRDRTSASASGNVNTDGTQKPNTL